MSAKRNSSSLSQSKRQRVELKDPEKRELERLLGLPIDWKPFLETIPGVDLALFEEYKKFLVLKVHLNDSELATLKLSPSAPVDEIWHSHMLLPRHYSDVCEMLLRYPGAIIEHSVLTSARPDREVRYSKTLELYKRFWGEPDAKYWPEEEKALPDKFQMFVKALDGKTHTLEVRGDAMISDVYAQSAEKLGYPSKLIFDGKALDPGESVRKSKLRRECTVHAVMSLRGC